MSRRYTYSRTIDTPEGKETFTAEQFDSFDEARSAVEKGVRDRRLQFPAKVVPQGLTPTPQMGPVGNPNFTANVAGDTTLNPPKTE